MANIEVFIGGALLREKVVDQIVRIMKRDQDAAETVITESRESVCRDLEGEEIPFIRVWCDRADNAKRIAELLNEKLDYDVEYATLDGFVPSTATKEAMAEAKS